MLSRNAGFDDLFNNSSKKYFSSSSIAINDTNGNSLLDTTHIERVETHLSNTFLCSTFPREETTITIIGWDTLSSAVKTYLTTKDKFVYIKYAIENIWTIDCRVCAVDEWEINYRENRATIKCVGAFNRTFMTQKTPTPFSSLFTSANGTFDVGFCLVDCFEKLYTFPVIDGKNVVCNANNGFLSSSNGFSLTKAEVLQNACIGCGGTARVNYDGANDNFKANIYDLNHIEDSVFNFDNIYDDISITQISNIKNVEVYGYTLGDVENLYQQGFFNPDPSFQITGDGKEGYNAIPYIIVSNTRIDPTGFLRITNGIIANFVVGAYVGGGTFYIDGQKILPPAYPQSYDHITITSYVLPDTDDTQKAIVKANAEKYLSYEKEVSFSCRINPAYEPLDYIYIDNLGYVLIEDIIINYNGGYSGRIKGKVVGVFAPVVSNLDLDTYTFDITNNNIVDMKVKIIGSDEYTFEDVLVPAGQTITINAHNNPDLVSFFDDYVNGTLADDIYCFLYQVGTTLRSDNVIILEEQV